MDMNCLHILAVVNTAAMNMGVLKQRSLLDLALDSFVYILRSGITGSYDNSTSINFNF